MNAADRAPSLWARFLAMHDAVSRVAGTIVGVPDYENYLQRFKAMHPGETPLSRNEFIKDRMDVKTKQRGCC